MKFNKCCIGMTLFLMFLCLFSTTSYSQVRVAIITGGHGYDKEPFEAMWSENKDIKVEYFKYNKKDCAFFNDDKYKD